MDRYRIDLASPPSEALSACLTDALAEAGQTLTADALAPFMFYMRDEAGTFLAGCKGEIAFRSAHVGELWVHSDLRGQGIGRALLQKAEDHARTQGCIRIHIETRNERARALYEACGFRVFGQLDRYEGENSYYYLEKRID
ncbi:MAG: GNAT family N-acetyltransferase [Pseudomonadota bacterium]